MTDVFQIINKINKYVYQVNGVEQHAGNCQDIGSTDQSDEHRETCKQTGREIDRQTDRYVGRKEGNVFI